MSYLIAALAMSPGFILGIKLLHAPFSGIVNKQQKRRLMICSLAAFVLNLIGLALAFSHYGLSMEVIRNDMPIFGTVITLISILVIPSHTKEHLLASGISMTCNNLLFNLTLFISVVLWGQETAESYIFGNIVNLALLIVCYFPLRNLMIKTVKPFLDVNSEEYWSGVWIIPLAMYFAMFFSVADPQQIGSLKFLVSRILVAVVTVCSCYAVSRDHTLARERNEMADQLNMQKTHYAQMEGRVMEIRKLAHDFKHHIAAIQHYIDTDDRDGLQEYCWELSDKPLSGVRIPYTGNTAVDGVMYRYAQLAKERGVQFDYFGSIQNCALSNMDLGVLLGNALDNALTGCMTLEQDRQIKVIMQSETHMVSVVVNNNFDGMVSQKGEVLYSRKRENEPGIGMNSMRSICEKYDADMDVKWDDNSFTVLFMLPVCG